MQNIRLGLKKIVISMWPLFTLSCKGEIYSRPFSDVWC